MYPHPASVRLFGLGRTFKYKARPGRPIEFRLSEFRRDREHRRGVRSPGLWAGEIHGVDHLGMGGNALERYEDLLAAPFGASRGI